MNETNGHSADVVSSYTIYQAIIEFTISDGFEGLEAVRVDDSIDEMIDLRSLMTDDLLGEEDELILNAMRLRRKET